MRFVRVFISGFFIQIILCGNLHSAAVDQAIVFDSVEISDRHAAKSDEPWIKGRLLYRHGTERVGIFTVRDDLPLELRKKLKAAVMLQHYDEISSLGVWLRLPDFDAQAQNFYGYQQHFPFLRPSLLKSTISITDGLGIHAGHIVSILPTNEQAIKPNDTVIEVLQSLAPVVPTCRKFLEKVGKIVAPRPVKLTQ